MGVCKKCCDKMTHTVISITGLSLSFLELIVAGIYNFHFIGFSLAIIGLITSGLYLYFNVKKEGA